jgi:hypothetical protein
MRIAQNSNNPDLNPVEARERGVPRRLPALVAMLAAAGIICVSSGGMAFPGKMGRIETRLYVAGGADCAVKRVEQDHAFMSGDWLRLQVRTRQSGYLYLVHESSRGKLGVLPVASDGSREQRIRAREWTAIPGGDWLKFDRNRGCERLYLVLADQPLTDPVASVFPASSRPAREFAIGAQDGAKIMVALSAGERDIMPAPQDRLGLETLFDSLPEGEVVWLDSSTMSPAGVPRDMVPANGAAASRVSVEVLSLSHF